jgi:hypothetical protein
MNNETQSRVQHFATLKSKYQATQYEDLSPSSLLYFILRKADLGIEITDFEFDWLGERKLFKTIETIWNEQNHREKELIQLEVEFFNLQAKYKATNYYVSWQSSPLYFILCSLDSENKLSEPEVNILKSYQLTETILIAQQMEHFATLKAKYQATKHQDSLPTSRLYQILKQLDAKERLCDSDVTWLNKRKLIETLAVFQQQEAAKEADFAQLKEKYQATKHPDLSVGSPLYPILQKLDAEKQLSESEIDGCIPILQKYQDAIAKGNI